MAIYQINKELVLVAAWILDNFHHLLLTSLHLLRLRRVGEISVFSKYASIFYMNFLALSFLEIVGAPVYCEVG